MADKHTIKINGEDKTVKMSFGLLNSVCRTLGDIDGAAQLMVDQFLREAILIQLLSDRDATGTITTPINIDTLDVDPEDVVALLDWAGDHALDFLLKGLERAKALQDKNLPRVRALMPSSNGTAA